MRINIVNSKNTLGYLIRSSILAIYKDINIIDKASTDDCELLIASEKDLKGKKVNKKKVLVYGKDIVSPIRSKQVRRIVNDFVSKNVHDEDIAVEVIKSFGIKALSKPKLNSGNK